VVRCLIEEFRMDVNQVDDDGFFALYSAAQEGHLAVVQCLVKEYGANVNQRAGKDGRSPLMAAACQLAARQWRGRSRGAVAGSSIWQYCSAEAPCLRARSRCQPSRQRWVHTRVPRSPEW
jgi:hypothetical protein